MKVPAAILSCSAAMLLTGLLSSCSTSMEQAKCTGTPSTNISPGTGMADHVAVAPGDEVQFNATSGPGTSPSCPVPEFVVKLTPTWTVSDTINVKISSAQDSTNGLATCLGTTKSPVTVTAISSPFGGGPSQTLGTATLTCK